MFQKIKIDQELFTKITPVLLISIIALSFLVGTLWQKVQYLEESGTKAVAGEGIVQPTPEPNGKLTADQAKSIPKISDADHIRGNRKAKAFLVVYSDLECPYCKQFHPTTKQVSETYKDDVAIVYRHFPLFSIHPKAQPAAEASECVAKIGGEDAFWKFIDTAFEGSPQSLGDLPGLAQKAGVDKAKFETCLNKGEFKDLVNNQISTGGAAGITGTPGSFVITDKGDAWYVSGAIPFTNLKSTIDEALASRK